NKYNHVPFIQYIDKTINYSLKMGEVGVREDLLTRLWMRPHRVIEYNNIGFFKLITGIGFKGLAGTMGMPQYPLAHNNYFDLLFSGGIFHLISFFALFLKKYFHL